MRRKTAQDEDFPVASRLMPARARATAMAFYRFARAADDVADDPTLPAEDKLARLDAMEPHAPHPEAARMLDAFRMDARGPVIAQWTDLMDYCALSAAPAGRFLLDVHGEPSDATPAADSLCAALQVLNHLSDLREDWTGLGRCYLPTEWLADEGLSPDVLAGDRAPPGLRRTLVRAAEGTAALLADARVLPRRLRSRSLRFQAKATLSVAGAHLRRLRHGDPLAERIKPGRADWMAAFASAWLP